MKGWNKSQVSRMGHFRLVRLRRDVDKRLLMRKQKN
jgi:hypothetical protein